MSEERKKTPVSRVLIVMIALIISIVLAVRDIEENEEYEDLLGIRICDEAENINSIA